MLALARWMPESPKWLILQGAISLKGDTVSSMHATSEETSVDVGQLSGTHGALSSVYQNPNYPRVFAMLRDLRPEGHDVNMEIMDILADARAEMVSEVEGAEVTWGEVFACRKGMAVGVGLMFFQVRLSYVAPIHLFLCWGHTYYLLLSSSSSCAVQGMTGTDSVVFYSTTIFGLAGFKEPIIGTSLVGAVNVFTTIVASNLIDRFGRKVLLLTGTYLM